MWSEVTKWSYVIYRYQPPPEWLLLQSLLSYFPWSFNTCNKNVTKYWYFVLSHAFRRIAPQISKFITFIKQITVQQYITAALYTSLSHFRTLLLQIQLLLQLSFSTPMTCTVHTQYLTVFTNVIFNSTDMYSPYPIPITQSPKGVTARKQPHSYPPSCPYLTFRWHQQYDTTTLS